MHKYDEVGQIMAYEDGRLDYADTVELFEHLLNTGTLWHLQGSYQRAAIRMGLIDAYGNRLENE